MGTFIVELIKDEATYTFAAVGSLQEAKDFCHTIQVEREHHTTPIQWNDEGSMTLTRGKQLFWCSETNEYYEPYWRITTYII